MVHSELDAHVVPKRELLRGTVFAAIVAAVILTVAVLPAEYGIDPTGLGKAMGLTKLHAESATPAVANNSAAVRAPAAAAAAAAVSVAGPAVPAGGAPRSTVSAPGEERALTISSRPPLPYRTDDMEILVAPGKGVEVKTLLAKGQTLIYTWKTKDAALVNHDFHGEPVNAKENEFESFILEREVSESRGTLIAPFTGVHGWYWKNKSTVPVTVALRASGFYSEIYKK